MFLRNFKQISEDVWLMQGMGIVRVLNQGFQANSMHNLRELSLIFMSAR